MTHMSVAPQSTPLLSAAPAAVAPGAGSNAGAVGDSAEGAPGGFDFAAVLKAQIALPAKDAPQTENIAALLPAHAAGEAEEGLPVEGLPAAPDLAAFFLPALAGRLPNDAANTAVRHGDGLAPAAGQPSLVPAQLTAEPPAGQPSLAAVRATDAQSAPPQAALLHAQVLAAPMAADAEASSGETGLPMAAQSHGKATGRYELAARLEPTADHAGTDAPQMPAADRARPSAMEPPLLAAAADTAKSIMSDSQMPATTASQAHATAAASPAAAGLHLGHAAPVASASPALRIDTPVGGHGWDAEVGQKVVLMVNRQESRAELTLTPPQLGKVEVTISINGDQTSATFVSASPAAREALEQALPRLREMMAEAGISLGQASVNAESAQRGRDEATTGNRGSGRGTDAAGAPLVSTQWVQRSSGLIDTFA